MEEEIVDERDFIIQTILEGWPLMPLVHRQYLPEVPAIYVALSCVQVPVYAGKTIHLRTRWQNHHHLKELLEFDSDIRIAWIMYEEGFYAPRDEWLATHENDLIQILRPPFNKEWKHIRS